MAKIILNGEVGVDITLYKTVQLVQDIKRQGDLSSLEVDVTSVGGSSVEGRDLYNYFKSLQIPVIMNAKDYVCSAAFTFYLAGTRRVAENKDVEFLMHSPKFAPDYFDMIYGLSDYELETLKKGVAEEKQILAKIYSEELGIEIETIKSLMDKDEIITAESAKSLGMISDIISEVVITPLNFNYKIAAKYYTNEVENQILNNLEIKKMEKEQIDKLAKSIEDNNKETKTMLEKFISLFTKDKVKALMVTSEDGTSIELVGDVLEVGAETVTPAEGTFTVIYEGKAWTVVIEANKITELTEVVEEETTDNSELENLKAENERLQKELDEIKASNAAIANKFAENEKYINELRQIKSQIIKEDGTVNFEGLKAMEQPAPTEADCIINKIKERKSKK